MAPVRREAGNLPAELTSFVAWDGTRVTALHVGYMNTDMVRNLDVPKSDPAVREPLGRPRSMPGPRLGHGI